MKEWFKFIGLSFFSDKIAKQAPSRGLGNMFLAAVLSFVFLLLGLIMAYTLTFDANYSNTPELVATVERTLSADGAALEIKDGYLYSDRIIDTVSNEEDRRNYYRGYDIIVDTRKADTFDDFTAYCVSKSGNEITYEDYLELDADLKTLYKFKVKYSGNERVINDEWVERCEAFLDEKTDSKTVKAYEKVKEKTGDEYAAAVYDLYVRSYYPSLTAYETNGDAPKTRNFYYHNYGEREKILFVFNDSMQGTFETDTGAKHIFYGYYRKMPNGKIGTSAAAVKGFISDSFDGARAFTVYSAVTAFFSVVPFIVLIVIAASVLLFCFTKLLKLEELKFGAAAKTVFAFLAWSAVIAAIITFALGFLVSQSLLAWLEGVVFFAVIAIRVAVMLIVAAVARKREIKNNAESKEQKAAEKAEEVDNDTVRG